MWGLPTPGIAPDRAGVPDGGCVGEATRALGGDIGDPEIVQRINVDSVRQAMEDPRVAAALAEWSACMAQRGYDYTTPWDPPADDWHTSPEPTADEIAVATADVECKESTDVITIWHAVDVELQTAMIAEHRTELERFEDDLQRRLDSARAVVREE